MKLLHRIPTLMLALVIAASILFGLPIRAGADGSGDPGIIRVGLYYGSTAIKEPVINTEGGVHLGVPNVQVPGSVVLSADIPGVSRLTIRREAFRLQTGPFFNLDDAKAAAAKVPSAIRPVFVVQTARGLYVRCGAYPNETEAHSWLETLASVGLAGTVYGSHRARSETLATYEEAYALWQRVNLAGITSSVAFDNGWSVLAEPDQNTDMTEGAAQGLVEQLSQAVGGSWLVSYPAPQRVEVYSETTNEEILVYENPANLPLRVRSLAPNAKGDTVTAIQGQYHRGELELRGDTLFTVVAVLSMDDYIRGVLPYEMAGDWPVEALKAQAVVARTFAETRRGGHASQGFDVTNTTLDQVYKGYAGEAANSNQAADETHGQVVLYQGRLVATFFSSNNGGYVADVSEVWGSSYPYLKAVPDEWSLSGAHANWTQNYAQSEMQSILRQVSGKDVGTLLRLNVAQRGPSGRVTELQVQGTAGTYSLFREGSRLNTTPGNGVSFALRSQLYEVVPNLPVRYAVNGAGEVVELPADLTGVSLQSAGEVTTLPVKTEVSVVGAGGTSALSLVPTGFTFNGHGWGHGIGLSQYGAKAMAEAGYSYSDILTHYYQAITISSEGD